MGTRADFYVGKNKDAEWIGSIAWDGYRSGIPTDILDARSEDAYRQAVKDFLDRRNDATYPEQGWPWPWKDSRITDCSYWFFDGRCWDENKGVYVPCDEDPRPAGDDGGAKREQIDFPDMSAIANVTFGERSGIMLFV